LQIWDISDIPSDPPPLKIIEYYRLLGWLENVEKETEETMFVQPKEVAEIVIITEECAIKIEENAEEIPAGNTNSQVDEATEIIQPAVMISATAVLDDSPNCTFMNDELDSLVRFITNKEHFS
jgi:hypothetical protein